MTETSISLLSIICGIIGAHSLCYLMPRYDFGLTGNSIAGVFGSIFLIKSLGRLGFDPLSIMASGTVHTGLLTLNLVVSFLGGCLVIVIAFGIKKKMNQ
ncbi:hypothetical protein SAMN04488028_101582 [Reichenbachiella agariperforans]|uniref:Uncharacterized protein n=1 Tax=Reichenbachiella agariperforans TaxID=156994 RepID=A0A1M6KHW2_REIAG|nr:hypothetical protein [Reichenbachiella agariperforans]SHJ58504.1 hypothetical protein SAMN04488028_101582 [Reichenbachiella agariperforans]